ncbi:DNA repair protein rhp26 [Termitomyces sp. T112]|nr:DNA repair protein rhp26 [Termitomyces sp. T112]
MPSHSAASGLIEIYFATTPPGIMWTWPTWQDVTGIHHGLFPDDDARLPPGLSRSDAIDIKAYFDAYDSIKSKTKKLSFATGSKGAPYHPGRAKWNTFVTTRWNRWDVHDKAIKMLREYGVHPATLLMNEGNIENKKAWLDSTGYIPLIIDPLGRLLFGDEAFPSGCELLPGKVRDGLQSIVQRVWTTTRVQLNRIRDKRDKIQAAAEEAMSNLANSGKPLTKTAVTQMIRAAAKWRDASELFSTPENTAAATEMLAQLQTVMAGLGVKVDKRIESKGASKVSALALKSLASAEDVSDIAALYHDYFELQLPDDDEPGLSVMAENHKSLNSYGGDFGMEVESSMNPAQLAIALGFTSGLPPIFVRYRHHTGANIWDDPHLFNNLEADLHNGVLSKFSLHWHQLAGVHSIVRTIFTEEPSSSDTLGALIGDEVGLGKTAQAIALIAFLNVAISAQKNKRAVPKIIRDKTFLGLEATVPSLPHLIVCPGTLMPQWGSEIKALLVGRAVDIFFYDGSVAAEQFWGPTGPFHSSEHRPHNRIVIASHSIIARDYSTTHVKPPKRKKNAVMPWHIPNARKDLTNTIFGQHFLVAIIDEAHNFRNPGPKHLAMLRLLQNARIRLPMTATPLHTSSRDIASMLRLAGVPHFFTEASLAEEKEDAAALRRAKKLDDDGVAANEEQVMAVKRLQKQAKGHFLRRTTESLNHEGRPLVALPPLVEITGVLKITPQEKAIMDKCNEQAKAMIDASESASPSEIKTTNFYNDYRVTIVWAKENPGDPYPTFKTLQDWQAVRTTKLDVAARICAHYTSRDDVHHVSFSDGLPVFPPPPPITAGITKTRRILMFAYFSSMVPLFQNVLSLYNVPTLAINGKISVAKRDKIVKTFYNDSQPARVLIISSVGSAGLNLTCADVIIFFDQPWSSQEEQQIRGRAWRQPQRKTVTEIHLFAEDSADLVMYNVARGKKDAFDVFVNKQTGRDLQQILSGSAIDDGHDVDDEATASHQKAPLPESIDLPEGATSDASSMLITDLDPISDAPSSRYSEPEELIAENDISKVKKLKTARGRTPIFVGSDDEGQAAASRAPRRKGPVVTPPSGSPEHGPTKRARQGTLGDVAHAQIIEDLSSVAMPPSTNTVATGLPRSFLSPRTEKGTREARTKLSDELIQIRRGLANSSASFASASAGPSRRLARLDDVAPPPRAALMGAPVKDKKSKGKLTKLV